MWFYLVESDKFRIFISVKQQVANITEVLGGLSTQIESMQKTIDSQYATVCQVNLWERFIVNQKWIAKKWNGTQRRRSTKFIFLREQSTQRVALISVFFAFSLNYSSASLCLCVRFFRKPILFYYSSEGVTKGISVHQYFESNGVPYHAFEKWYKKKLQQAGIADCVVEGAPSSASHPIGSVIFNGLLAIKKDPQLLFVGLCPITVISVL